MSVALAHLAGPLSIPTNASHWPMTAHTISASRPGARRETLTAYIVQVSAGDIQYGSVEYLSIYAVGITLFAITLGMNLLANYISSKFREDYGG